MTESNTSKREEEQQRDRHRKRYDEMRERIDHNRSFIYKQYLSDVDDLFNCLVTRGSRLRCKREYMQLLANQELTTRVIQGLASNEENETQKEEYVDEMMNLMNDFNQEQEDFTNDPLSILQNWVSNSELMNNTLDQHQQVLREFIKKQVEQPPTSQKPKHDKIKKKEDSEMSETLSAVTNNLKTAMESYFRFMDSAVDKLNDSVKTSRDWISSVKSKVNDKKKNNDDNNDERL